MNTPFVGMEALAYALGSPTASASIKQELDDFQVDEELGFEFTGSGEHLYLKVRKSDLSTAEAARRLQAAAQIPAAAISYAGMKDRRGHCTQWFSLRLAPAQERRLAQAEAANLVILERHRNARKLKIGSHKANRFRLRLRHCTGPAAAFSDRLEQMQTLGVPNYFGEQRFGRNLSNLSQAQALLTQVLSAGNTSRTGSGGRHRRGMLYSAARSYVFNQLLSRRIAENNWHTYVAGDVLNLAGSNRCFAVEANAWDAILQQRLQKMDIHLTGPLPGSIDCKDKYISYGEAADIEGAVLAQFPTLVAGLKRCGVMAARRALRFTPGQLQWHWPAATTLELSFTLPKGCYATSLLRELCHVQSHESSTLIHAE